MKKDEVPQDKSCLSKANIKEVVYAVDEQGNYNKALSSGWEAKNTVLNESLHLIEERLYETKQALQQGEVSPIAYYMELHKMDVTILASYVGFWKFKVKRHLRPKVFARLKKSTLKKYAEIFEISVSELKKPKF
ncbi:hypothetical protein ACE939_04865 [Aquimarina sp. W85]|uniref:hypothetical protein n=1 Tax=Aquimarina rhodophyticola TaxID=3342246 RepID=UPI00366EBD7D